MKSKHVVLLIVLAAIAAFAYLEVRQRTKGAKAADRAQYDREIHSYFETTVKPALPAAAGEPTQIARPILPVAPPHPVGLDLAGAILDLDVFNQLEPGERTDRLSDAGSIAIIERANDGVYAGGGGAGGMVSTGAVVTVFDVESRRAVGKLVVQLRRQPPEEATQAMIDEYRDWFAGTIAARLHALPPARR